MIAMIRQTWAGLKARPQSARSKRNSPRSNLPRGLRSPTLVHATSGRKYGWLGFSRRSIGALSRDRTIWNSSGMDPCTGRRRLQIFWRLSRIGCPWKTLIMRNGFGNNGLRCFWRNMPVRFGRRGRREGEATSNRQRIWVNARVKKWQVTSQGCQIQLSWVCDSSSAERQQWPDIQHAIPSFVHGCEALGGADCFHRRKLWPERTILSNCVMQMQLDSGRIGRRVYGIIRTGADDEWPSIWSDIVQQFPFKCLQVETGTRCATIFDRNEGSDREGYCRAHNETSQGNPRELCYGKLCPKLIRILRLWRDLMKMKEWWMTRQAGKRLIVLM